MYIAVINAGTVLADPEVAWVTRALQTQVLRDFAPVWGLSAVVTSVPRGAPPPPGAWQLLLLDDTDRPGVSGVHDVAADVPVGRVFAGTAQREGVPWSLSASHELLEMLADPFGTAAVVVGGAQVVAQEVCDPCEVPSYGYRIDGVPVSDFVWPSWFAPSRGSAGTVFDQTGSIQHPLEVLPGGFVSVLSLPVGTGWTEVAGPGSVPTSGPPAAGSGGRTAAASPTGAGGSGGRVCSGSRSSARGHTSA